jgi:prepilin-type N-terminal cleavage/methylation domain-containing protein
MSLRARAGFTLVELLVAVVLVDAGLLALAGTTAWLARRNTEIRTRTAAVAIASNRLQSLSAVPCAPRSGTAANGALVERWSEADQSHMRELRDTVRFSIATIDHAVVLTTRLPC